MLQVALAHRGDCITGACLEFHTRAQGTHAVATQLSSMINTKGSMCVCTIGQGDESMDLSILITARQRFAATRMENQTRMVTKYMDKA
jgi:hypothetical protein